MAGIKSYSATSRVLQPIKKLFRLPSMGLTADWDIRFVAICSKESKLYWIVSFQVRGERVHISVSQ